MRALNKELLNRFKKQTPLPYCKDSNILESCKKCENNPCISICPTNIITKKDSRIYLDFKEMVAYFARNVLRFARVIRLGCLI